MNKFRVTDGTLSVDFLSLVEDGARLIGWKPKIIQPKRGGVYQDSPLADGRRRVYSKSGNAIELLTFSVEESCLNDVFGSTSALSNLLEKGVDYWEADYQSEPVYLEVDTEDGNTQYALIVSYSIPELDNPFAQPMYSKYNALLNEVTLEIERGEWLAQIPGQSSQVNTLVIDSERSDEGISYVASRSTNTLLTHIYVDDGGVFGSNQIAATSFDLLPAAPAINDALYLGNNIPYTFSSLIFDLVTGFAGTTVSGVWEVWTGAAWATAFDVSDKTSGLATTGVNSVVWRISTSWATTSVNGVTAYWIRFRVTAATGVTTIPAQQNRIVYTVTWPYIDVAKEDVLGDTEALAQYILRKNEGTGNPATQQYFLGLRSLSRGSDFDAYLNLSDNQVPAGITITLGNGCSYNANTLAPANSDILYDAATDPDATGSAFRKFYIDMATSLSQQYIGRFRVYIGAYRPSGNQDYLVKLVIGNSDDEQVFYDSGDKVLEYSTTGSGGPTRLTDLGTAVIPNSIGEITNLRWSIYLTTDTKSMDIQFVWMLIMPVDEWSILVTNVESGPNGLAVDNNKYEDIDSVSDLRTDLNTTIKNNSDDSLYSIQLYTANGPAQLKNNTDQRIWTHVLFESDALQHRNNNVDKVSVFMNERYKILRGNR